MADVRINSIINDVKVSKTKHEITITNNANGTTVNVTPTNTGTVTISAPGPKGHSGLDGNIQDIPSANIIQPFTHITASGHISASGTGSFSYINVGQYIKHIDDPNTYLNFTEDRLRFNIGGISYLDLNDASTAPHDIIFNNGNNNVDLTIKGSSSTILFTDASTHRVGIGTDTPGETLEVVGNISASGVISGSTIVGTTGSFDRVVVNDDLSVTEYIKHKGDENTAIRFTDNKISFDAGGMTFFAVHDDNSAPFTATVNGGGNTINFKVLDEAQKLILKTDSEASTVALYSANNKKLETVAGGVEVTGHVTASGEISASGNLYGDDLVLGTGRITTANTYIDYSSTPLTGITHITSSGNISASGYTAGSDVYVPVGGKIGIDGIGGNDYISLIAGQVDIFRGGTQKLSIQSKDVVVTNADLRVSGQITASSNISSSGNIYGNIYYSNGKGLGVYSSVGNIVALSSNDVKTNINGTEITIGNTLTTDNINLISPVTASGDISASGVISASIMNATTGSFPHIITLGSTIEFRAADGKTKIGALKYDTTDGLQGVDASDKPQRMKIGRLFISHPDEGDGYIHFIKGDITSSGEVKANTLKIIDQVTAAEVSCSQVSSTGMITGTRYNSTTTNGYYITSHKSLYATTGTLHVGVENTNSATSMSGTEVGIYTNHNQAGAGTGNLTLNSHKDKIILKGNVSASGTISASSQIIAPEFVGNLTAREIVVGSLTATSITSSIVTSSIVYTEGSNIFGDSSDDTQTFNGSITASGDISASGTIEADGFISDGKNAIQNTGPAIVVGNQTDFPVKVGRGGTTNIELRGPVTASGNISASGAVIAATGSFGTGTTTVTDKIVTTGNINTEGTLTATGLSTPHLTVTGKSLTLGSSDNAGATIIVHGKIQSKGSEITIESGSISASNSIYTAGAITASGDISSSGNITAGAGATGSFDHIVTMGDTITFKNPSTGAKIGAMKFDATDGLKVHDHQGAATHIEAKEVKGFNVVRSDGTLSVGQTSDFSGNAEFGKAVFVKNALTASSGVSSSGNIITPTIQATTATLTNVVANDIQSRNLTATGKVQIKGSDITMMSGSISMSGDLIATGSVTAGTGSFGSGTTTITDYIHSTGNISGSSVATSGVITAVGNITTNATLNAATVDASSQVTAPTLRTDSGNFVASGKTLTLGAPERRGQDLIVYGAIKVKGSDITMMSGSISASGDLIMTGSISASGNISAGAGSTGSFDHIITTNNTIEFRNSANRDEVLGLAKFDPVEGLTVHSASYGNNNRNHGGPPNVYSVMPKVANKLVRTNGSDILVGGVAFNAMTNINLPGVNIAGNQNTSGRAATATLAAGATTLATPRTIGGVSFDGSANINLPGVNTAGNQNTTGTAATASFVTGSAVNGNISGNAASATKLETARTIGGVSFDGRKSITPTSHMGSDSSIFIHPTQFRGGIYNRRSGRGGLTTTAGADVGEIVSCACMIPIGKSLVRVTIYSSNVKTEATVNNLLLTKGTWTALVFENNKKQITTINASQPWGLYTTVLGGTYLQSGLNNLQINVTMFPTDYLRGVRLDYM